MRYIDGFRRLLAEADRVSYTFDVIEHEYININKEIVYKILMDNLFSIKTIVSKIVQSFS